jgi:hypothetical protein
VSSEGSSDHGKIVRPWFFISSLSSSAYSKSGVMKNGLILSANTHPNTHYSKTFLVQFLKTQTIWFCTVVACNC